MSQIIAARCFSCSTTFSAAIVAAMPVAKVTRLPPVTWVKPIEPVSADDRPHLARRGICSTSATIMPIEAREPPISGLPDTATTEPSSATCTAADDSPPMLNQKPVAMPAPLPRLQRRLPVRAVLRRLQRREEADVLVRRPVMRLGAVAARRSSRAARSGPCRACAPDRPSRIPPRTTRSARRVRDRPPPSGGCSPRRSR